ncbi:MAG TPA: hypothetical protein VFQ44_26290 [Streptosporangiaceae bacterium]|nr:hypothetical protein [Streptosporangiaceae bacterium]
MSDHPASPSGGKAVRSLHPASGLPATPGIRVSVALALLGPINPWLDDLTTHVLGGIQPMHDLESDPRYVIGRLHQALTSLLTSEIPPMDETSRLLSEAIDDALTCRRTTCTTCVPERMCAACRRDWRKADEYETLFGQLGLIADSPE